MNIIKKTYLIIAALLLSTICLPQTDSLNVTNIHSPKKATIYSAVLPGLGQAYNKKYWKIPIVYAGIGTLSYFIVDNQKEFNRFKNAYKIRMDNGQDEFYEILNEQGLINEMDRWRRYRDFCIIGTALVYILQIVDANVDAHLYDFDVGDNLTLRVFPKQFDNNFSRFPMLGVGCSLKF